MLLIKVSVLSLKNQQHIIGFPTSNLPSCTKTMTYQLIISVYFG